MKTTQTIGVYSKAVRTIRPLIEALRLPDSFKNLSKTDVLLCCHDANRGETLQGKAYSRLIDSVSEDLASRGWRCSQFALPYSRLIGEKAWGNPVSANRACFVGLILKRFSQILTRIGFRSDTGVLLYCGDYRKRVYEKILEITEPKCVITIGAPAELCRVGRSRKIPVVELLHGNGFPYVPWGWGSQDQVDLPSGILSLDDVSTKSFSVLKSKGVEIYQIPDPWLSRFGKHAEKERVPVEWRNATSWIPNKRKIVIVTLMWGYANDHGPNTEFANILENGLIHEEIIRAIEQTRDSCFWLIRRHPVQVRSSGYDNQTQFLEKLIAQNRNCEWQKSSTLPLPLLLRHCDGLVTMMSLSAYDGAYMKVPSLLLCPTLKPGGVNDSYFIDLCAEGYAKLGNFDAECIKEWALTVTQLDEPFHSKKQQDWALAVQWMLGSEKNEASSLTNSTTTYP